jgi:flagellar biosynthesis protein
MSDKKEKIDKAAALAYDHIGAPRIVAKGSGELARKIIETAQAEGIPLQKNEQLIEALMQIELTKEIPPQLYRAVAEILALIYRLEKMKSS